MTRGGAKAVANALERLPNRCSLGVLFPSNRSAIVNVAVVRLPGALIFKSKSTWIVIWYGLWMTVLLNRGQMHGIMRTIFLRTLQLREREM